MKTPVLRTPVPRWSARARTTLTLFCAIFGACNCGFRGAAGASCKTFTDCASGLTCVAGKCTRGGGDGGAPGDGGAAGDGGSDAGACATPCGAGCCTAGQSCQQGKCYANCAATETVCGDPGNQSCCSSSQLCYLGACITPGPACSASSQCPQGDYCDPTVGHCLPLAGGTPCEYHPPAGQFAPSTLWNYQVTTDNYTQVMMAPVVIDVNGDGLPDVLASFFAGSAYGSPGVMRALSGDDGHLLWTSPDVAGQRVIPEGSIAAGDLDGSGKIEVFAYGDDYSIYAFDAATGAWLWRTHDAAGNAVACQASWGGPSLADLDGDGNAEVVCGLEAFDKNGLVKWNHGKGAGSIGPLSVAADLDGQPGLEVTDGANAYHADGSPYWTAAGFGGFPAVADFVTAAGALGRDGAPEIVSVNAGQLALVNGQTGAILAGPTALPSWNGSQCVQGGGTPGNGGPPTVADFDGDGEPEVGVADQDCYTVFKLSAGAGSPQWNVLWSKKVQDHSSSVTGSSVFDFEGDGPAEVVYADEVALHVYKGVDGTEIFTRPHCSGTTYEYPLIVDVNGNGRADIVIAENTYAAGGLGCDPTDTAGIHVFHDGKDNWVNTRAIWNEHVYHVTNVCDGQDYVCGGPGAAGNTYGRVPAHEPSNWTFTNAAPGAPPAPLDNFRQNVQGEGLFNAPDLVGKDLAYDQHGCPTALDLSVRVLNQGALGVLPGIPVAFYLLPSRTLLGVGHTTQRLLPGQSEIVTIAWTVPSGQTWPIDVVADVNDDGTGQGVVNECNTSNNEAGPIKATCQTFGLR